MHAWIGLFFSCTMMIVAAIAKSDAHWVPTALAATPSIEFMFLLGCAGFGAALAMIAPSHSTARLASLWSSAGLAIFVVVLNLDGLSANRDKQIEPPQTRIINEVVKSEEAPLMKFTLKRTVHEGEWQPFQDFEGRLREVERSQPQLPEDNETTQVIPTE